MKIRKEASRKSLYNVMAILVMGATFAPAWPDAQSAPAANTAKGNPCVVPVSRSEGWWKVRFNALNDSVMQGKVDLIFIGDSITQGWEGPGRIIWERYYGKRKLAEPGAIRADAPLLTTFGNRNAVNLGIGGDQTQHVLWRLDNGNVTGISPKLAVVMIGTNNAAGNSVEEIVEGVGAIVKKLEEKLPTTRILLLGILPREEKPGKLRAKLAKVNEALAKMDDGQRVFFLDIGQRFLRPDGTLPKDIMPDSVHPNIKGYEIWAESIEPKVIELMGEKKF